MLIITATYLPLTQFEGRHRLKYHETWPVWQLHYPAIQDIQVHVYTHISWFERVDHRHTFIFIHKTYRTGTRVPTPLCHILQAFTFLTATAATTNCQGVGCILLPFMFHTRDRVILSVIFT